MDEKTILQSKINKLKLFGLNNLAEQVYICYVYGYDINSFDKQGNEIYIKVKTNSNSK